MTTSCSVSLKVCLVSMSSALMGGSQKGCVEVVAVAVDGDEVRSMILRCFFSFSFRDGAELAIHSSGLVTSDTFGRGTEAYFRHTTNDVYKKWKTKLRGFRGEGGDRMHVRRMASGVWIGIVERSSTKGNEEIVHRQFEPAAHTEE